MGGKEHGPAATQMLLSELGNDISKQQLALDAALKALNARIALWDAVMDAINTVK